MRLQVGARQLLLLILLSQPRLLVPQRQVKPMLKAMLPDRAMLRSKPKPKPEPVKFYDDVTTSKSGDIVYGAHTAEEKHDLEDEHKPNAQRHRMSCGLVFTLVLTLLTSR